MFITKYKYMIYWYYILAYQILCNKILENFKYILDWFEISIHQILSERLIEKYTNFLY